MNLFSYCHVDEKVYLSVKVNVPPKGFGVRKESWKQVQKEGGIVPYSGDVHWKWQEKTVIY